MYAKGHDTLQCAPSTIVFTEFNYSISECREGRQASNRPARVMSVASTHG
jgi:hypothetical protein